MRAATRGPVALALAGLGLLAAAGATLAATQGDEAVNRLLFEAERRQSEGDVEGALRNYELLSQQFPQAPQAAEALLRLVNGHRALGRADEAEEAARALIETHPRSRQAAGAYTQLGEMLAARATASEELAEAQAMLDQAVLLFPRTSHPRLGWRSAGAVLGAQTGLQLGLDAEAARAFADVIDHELPSAWTARARLGLAGLLLELDRWQEAAELLQEVVAHSWSSEEELAVAARAANRLDLIHRFWLRPLAGQPRWLDARLLSAVPKKPSAVAAHDDGRVAVTGAGDGWTVELDAAGKATARWRYDDPERCSWGEGELLLATKEFVASLPERSAIAFAAPLTEKKPTLMPLVAAEPAAFGQWFVLTAKPERLLMYQAKRRRSRALVEGRGREPVDLARDRRGRLLVLDRRARSVTRFSADGATEERLIAGGWRQARALAVDAVGNVYVLDRESRRVEIFDRRGEALDSVGPILPGGLELRAPMDLSLDGAGRLWIADARVGLVVLE